MSSRVPAEVFPPGEFIRDELEARGWSQTDLARILGRPLPTVNQIMSGKVGITPTTAGELAEAFGTSAEFWLNLEVTYRLSLVNRPGGEVRKRAQLYEIAPVREMERRHWIKRTKTAADLQSELNRFFGVKSLDERPAPVALAARASAQMPEDEIVAAAQIAWCHRALQLAAAVHSVRFSKETFEQGCKELRQLAAHPEETRKVPRVLADMGVRLVVVEHLPKTGIDGAVLWTKPSPIIALSMRFDRIDCFWHTLAHELSHVRHRDRYALDVDLVGDDRAGNAEVSDVETRANAEAASMLIPSEQLESYMVRVKPYYSKERIIQFARRVAIHPGIVAGQLQYRGEIKYSATREMLVRVRDILIESAMTDGWGKVVSLS